MKEYPIKKLNAQQIQNIFNEYWARYITRIDYDMFTRKVYLDVYDQVTGTFNYLVFHGVDFYYSFTANHEEEISKETYADLSEFIYEVKFLNITIDNEEDKTKRYNVVIEMSDKDILFFSTSVTIDVLEYKFDV